ncbi:guanylate kinase [Smaragdicoccus niigatensis]|uniref:guanylate kinase n=1 Tax=Smaragdicoccus niigatensis TaxID=359359 RepID=UPI000685126D|nr:guanylate kinase [Smaragdicoccus niigatensis]
MTSPTSSSTSGSGRGRLVVLVGPSAVGKSTVVRRLKEQLPELVFSVSATTRAPRPGEVEGRDYYFVTDAEFDRMIDTGDMLEWATIHGLQRSGTPAAPVRAALEAGHPVLVEVDLQGARLVRAAMPEAISVFIAPPSWDELVARLRGRGTESPEAVARRLETARTELAAQDEFDVVLVNDAVQRVCDELVSLMVGAYSDPTQTSANTGERE